MDPNANLREQLALANRLLIRAVSDEDAERLAELVLAMNEWLSSGGFLPQNWEKSRALRK